MGASLVALRPAWDQWSGVEMVQSRGVVSSSGMWESNLRQDFKGWWHIQVKMSENVRWAVE